MKPKFKFIDLFAGIGGFHIAMTDLGGECVFASEIDRYAIETYKENFDVNSDHDIRRVDPKDIPYYDVLCAGFPCQAFSKAGSQKGFNDETKGTLFFEIERLIKYRIEIKKPVKYIILENVSNLVSHDQGNTWKVIKRHLESMNYILTEKPLLMSPHQIGIPQLRNRVYILGIHRSYGEDLSIQLPRTSVGKRNVTQAYSIIDEAIDDPKYRIDNHTEKILDIWEDFYQGIKEETIGFPIWVEAFKVKPDIQDPKWKQEFVYKNNQLYKDNKEFIDSWLKRHKNLKNIIPSHRKFEWQAGAHIDSIWDGIIQFRPSGIRVKRPTEFPALVAMVHIPIIGKYKRYLTEKEISKLQSFPESFIPNKNIKQSYKQFGNSVNIEVVKYLAKQLIK